MERARFDTARRWAALLVLAPLLAPALEACQEPASEDDTLLEDDDLDFLDDELDELLGESEPGEGSGGVLRDWKGFVELRPRVYLEDTGGAKNDEQLQLEAELELDLDLGDSFSAFLRPRLLFDAFDEDLHRVEPYEAYVTWAGEGWDLRAGQFVENWGIVDTYNPIDVVNRRDLATDFLDTRRLGELGLRYRHSFEGGDTVGEPTVSLYALPVWRETLFAPEDQRFSFDSPLAEFDEDQGFEPSGDEGGFYAARFASTLTTGPANADVQFLVSHGPERTPSIFQTGGGELAPAYFGALSAGLGFRAVPNEASAGRFLSTLTLKAEVVFKSPYEFDGSPIPEPDDYVAYVLGVDRAFYNVLRDQDVLTMTLEYAGEDGASDPAATFRPFRDDLILRGLWELNDFARSSLELRGIYDLETDETIVEARYDRQLRSVNEDLKFTLQLQHFDPPGTGESVFDFFPDNTSIAVGLRLDF